MPEIMVIADTSCLIALTNIGEIGLLKDLYGEVYITEEIAREFDEQIPEWIKIENVKNQKYQQLLNLLLDAGEASAIALALENEQTLLILDDLKGRKEADKMGLKSTGTLGLLVKAKSTGLIHEIKPLVERLKAKGFRFSAIIEKEILTRCNEE